MKKPAFIILITIVSCPAFAEVFKCKLPSGETVYQSTACPSAVEQKVIEVKPTDPVKAAEAAEKLKNWEADFANRERDAEIIAEQEKQAQMEKEAAARAALQAEEARRQAQIQEQNENDMRLRYQRSFGYQGVQPYNAE